jgi:hypothetical protein
MTVQNVALVVKNLKPVQLGRYQCIVGNATGKEVHD